MNLSQQLEKTLQYLQERRKGYKYSITLSCKNSAWTCCVTGESTEDRSYPHDFVSCRTEDFEQLPHLIMEKAKDSLAKEIAANEARVNSLIKSNEILQAEASRIQSIQL